MKESQDYIRDIAEIRSMMERSSKFLSLSGWAGIMAGLYALAGAYVVYGIFHFDPVKLIYDTAETASVLPKIIGLGILIFVLALITAFYFSRNRALKNGEKAWNITSKHLLAAMAVPLAAGGMLIFILISKGILGLIAPLMLLFYGLALYNASKFTIDEVKYLSFVQIGLGLMGSWFIEYGLLIWAIGFGAIHIIYGIYMYVRYEQ